jgi:hypothetical protein
VIGPFPVCTSHGSELVIAEGKFGVFRRYPTMEIQSRLLVCPEQFCWRWAVERVTLDVV